MCSLLIKDKHNLFSHSNNRGKCAYRDANTKSLDKQVNWWIHKKFKPNFKINLYIKIQLIILATV